ncbi:MAG: GP88 family protein [Mycobacteriaceae bacterium]
MFDLDARPASLLTTGNPKTAKGEGAGYLTAILHLAPASLSGRNVCSHATAGCRAACLNTAGRGGIALDADGLNTIQAARIRRTRYFTQDRDTFMRDLGAEISKHVRTAERHGLKPAVRLNGTSDLPWENIRYGEHRNLFEAFPNVQFYDYTKVPVRIRRRALNIRNYSLTFSLAESNADNARDALAAGLSVAAVFSTRKGQDLPATFFGAPVIDGDLTDLRFTDPAGVIVGLRAKGRAKQDTSGFVQVAA